MTPRDLRTWDNVTLVREFEERIEKNIAPVEVAWMRSEIIRRMVLFH
jgi:hypothetical protein